MTQHLRWLVMLGVLGSAGAPLAAQAAGERLGRTLDEIPAGALHDDLRCLPRALRTAALDRLADFPAADARSLRVDQRGRVRYVCRLGEGAADPGHPAPGTVTTRSRAIAARSAPVAPVLHSKAGSANRIYLCFVGGVVSGTIWNSTDGVSSWTCNPYGQDADDTTFSAVEQTYIRQVWERVSEDFAPFDVDVTTEAPTTWDNRTAWAMITETVDANGLPLPHDGFGGVAYVGVFGDSDYHRTYSPAWVKAMGSAANTAEAASHELGHNLGLSHDGTAGSDYYGGHDGTAAAPSWGPIMGTGYGQDLSQWSQGEYAAASNTQDDLAIMAALLGSRGDDVGDTAGAATLLSSGSFNVSGIIGSPGDSDVYRLTTGGGTLDVSVTPYRAASGTWGTDLDAVLELRDAAFALVSGSGNPANPATLASASLNRIVAAGTYYLVVKATGAGTPMTSPPSGYTAYGSLGQYTLAGTAPTFTAATLGVSGKGLPIADGDPTPSASDGTDLGGVLLGATGTGAFILQNIGSGTVHLTGTPRVQLSGSTAFSLQSDAASTSLSGSTQASAVIAFTPVVTGTATATVSIASDSPADGLFTFVIRARGNLAPVADAKTATVYEDVVSPILLTGSDDDAIASWQIVTPPAHGTASISGSILTYRSGASYSGSDSLTVRAVDRDGAVSAPAAVGITVLAVNDPPVPLIGTPGNFASVPSGATIAFIGSATDEEDGSVPAGDLTWLSNRDGTLGTGASIGRVLSDGTHQITLLATDRGSAVGATTITLQVGASPSGAPTAVISGGSGGGGGCGAGSALAACLGWLLLRRRR